MARYKKVYKFNRRKATFRKVKPKKPYYKKRYHKKRKGAKLTKFRLGARYPDLGLVKLRQHFTSYDPPLPALDVTTPIDNSNVNIFNLNAAVGTSFFSNINGAINFAPLNFAMFSTRYNRARPMGCKLVLRIQLPDSATLSNTPLIICGFPYQSQMSTYGNYWNESNTVGLSCNNIPQMPYCHTKRIYGAGNKGYVTFKHYISFPKLLGMTRAQFMARDDIAYDIDNSVQPLINMKYCLAVADFITTANRTYQIEGFITQYTRLEGPDLGPF